MDKKIIDSTLFKTTIILTNDYVKIMQLDKITDLQHKIILNKDEIDVLNDIIKNYKE